MAKKTKRPKWDGNPYSLFDNIEYDFTLYYPDLKRLIIKLFENFPLRYRCSPDSPSAKNDIDVVSELLWEKVELVSEWHYEDYCSSCRIDVFDKNGSKLGCLANGEIKDEEVKTSSFLSYTDWLAALGCILPYVNAYLVHDELHEYPPKDSTYLGRIYIGIKPLDISEALELAKRTLKRPVKKRSLRSGEVPVGKQASTNENTSVTVDGRRVDPDRWIVNASIDELCDIWLKQRKPKIITSCEGFNLPDTVLGIDFSNQTMFISKITCSVSRKKLDKLEPGTVLPIGDAGVLKTDYQTRSSSFFKDRTKVIVSASEIPVTRTPRGQKSNGKKPEWTDMRFVQCEEKYARRVDKDTLLYVLYHNNLIAADVINGYKGYPQ